VTVDTNSVLYIRDKRFRGTRGLCELLTRKKVDNRLVSANDLKRYKEHFEFDQCSFGGIRAQCPIHVSHGIKFRTVLAKLFPQTRRRDIEASLHRQWEKY